MDLFGITPEECVAFGDQYNDVEMLETVGMGYAMSNAAPGIAGHAKYITDSVFLPDSIFKTDIRF